jgi:glycosyltransferase involved in cell wall biosynthesis
MNPFDKDQKMFSIISPCYGDDWKHLPKNLDTLKSQEYKTFEWIVVFDGKSIGGVRTMNRLIKENKEMKISYFTIEHGGAPKARNYGATQAKGDYFVFLNADNYLYPESLRMWADAFEDKSINRVWGLYDVITTEGMKYSIGNVPVLPNGEVWYKAFKYSNYCDSTCPIRKTAYIPWDETVKSLQDWDWGIRQLKRDNFEGKDWKYIHHSFFAAEDAEPGGLSDDSHQNWIDRTDYVRNKNGIPKSDICVTSLGAPHHGFHIADKLGADYLPMPSFKAHKYKMIYLVGFYTAEDPANPITTTSHMQVFEKTDAVKIIHWVGTDIMQIRRNCSFEKLEALRAWFKEQKIIHLCEADFTQKELKEVGIKARIIPIPPKTLNEPMKLPEKFTVGIYESNVSPMYNRELMFQVIKSMPDIQFYFFGEEANKGQKGDNYEHLGYVDMKEWMPKMSCNLRISVHDGLPLLPIEFMTAGRNVITNVPLKGAYVVGTERKEVCNAIRKAQENSLNLKWSKYWRKKLDFKKYKERIWRLI